MTGIRDLYYAIWANLSAFSVTARSSIVLAAAVILVWVIVRPIFLKLLLLLLRLAGLLVKLFCLLGGKLLGVTARKSPEQYAARYNRMAGLMGRCDEHLHKRSEQLSGNHKFHLGRMLLLYIGLMALIVMPNLLEPVVSEEYVPYFSAVSNLYQRMEAPALKKSAAYSPLFSRKYDTSDQDFVSVEDTAPEVWLPLSEQGRSKSNLRSGPGTDNSILDTLSGDMQVLYLGERSGRWVHVCTADGIEGWIHDSLVTCVPEETTE